MPRVSTLLTAAVLALAFLAGSIIQRAAAQAVPATSPTPTRLAVINIVKAFSSLNEKIQGDTEMESEAKKIDDERKKKEDKVTALNESLKHPEFKRDSPEFKKLQDDALNAAIDLQVFLTVSKQRLLIMTRIKTEAIYRSMTTAIQKYAESHGIAMVFVTDDPDLSTAEDINALTSRIAMRKVVYAHPDYDITNKIIEQMNTDYRLGTK